MPIITFSVPDSMKKDMEQAKIINWSEVARTAIKTKLEELKILKEISKKSRLTEKDALKLGRMINKSMAQRYIDEANR